MKCKRKRKGVKIQQFVYRDTANVELKCAVVPVIVGATGMVTESLRKNVETIPDKHSIDSLQ
jgi:hypothetical protein